MGAEPGERERRERTGRQVHSPHPGRSFGGESRGREKRRSSSPPPPLLNPSRHLNPVSAAMPLLTYSASIVQSYTTRVAYPNDLLMRCWRWHFD
jgi:hypothetical protein